MNKHTNRIQPRGTRTYIVMASLVCLVLLTELALAGTRQFLVILANSPKEGLNACTSSADCPDQGENTNCVGGACLINPEIIRRQYFEDASFAEYWEEISYGDIKINGKATEWLSLPWPISPKTSTSFVDLNGNGRYNYGAGELFDNTRPMVRVDLGRGVGTTYANGGQDTVPNSSFPVWMPGERFLDVDGDGVWDGLDEATNQMDFFAPCGANTDCAPFGSSARCIQSICIDGDTGAPLPDGLPDLLGPWIDFNGDGIAEAPAACIYLPDSDNDGNPDCCPNGPGTKGCEPFADDDVTHDGQDYNPDACPAMTWPSVRPDGVLFPFNDCNGNLIPDECDVSCVSALCQATGWLDDPAHAGLCGTSRDELPRDVQGDQCDGITADDTPDECQFVIFDVDCVGSTAEEGTPCGGRPVCEALGPPVRDIALVTRCEYDDSNGNGALDIVEPFENFLHGVGTVVDSDYKNYVRANYPGHPDRVIAQADPPRVLLVRHDPLGKLPSGECRCNPGTADEDFCTVGRCIAGEHVQYDPPDLWVEEGSAKVQYVLDEDGNRIPVAFPAEPSWYKQAWIDRYGTTPPNWNALTGRGGTPLMETLSITVRGDFFADRGGTNGDGTGALADGDCGTADVDFRTDAVAERNFVALCDDAILPEQLNGIAADLIFYDGPLEHDDLPSSKYHRAGDQALGEVTSPFHNKIWGDGFVAGGPYATQVHGNFGRPAGNVLHMELLSVEFAPGFPDTNLDGIVDQGESKLPGGENYVDEPCCGYPNNHERLIEDCIAILDDNHDFDDFVDPIAMDAVECVGGGGRLSAPVPPPLSSGTFGPNVNPSGILSGIVLLPSGSPFTGGFPPSFLPIHNEDGLGDPNYVDTDLPRSPRIPSLQPDFAPQINWNIFVHSLVLPINGDFQIRTAANAYLRSWEGFPVLYDPDRFGPPGAIENCPIGFWDIMADGGLVHSIPVLKAKTCTEWIAPVDLATLLTPGVDATLTLPRSEFVRDNSYFFLENEDRLGERYYFWSAGLGFDQGLPGSGMLVLHTDVGANPDALPPGQRSGDRPTYVIVQADGLRQLQACQTGGNRGDASDPWPGSSNATDFDFETIPAAKWYTENSWTGLTIRDVVSDGSGSVQLTINWIPTTVPGMRFDTPPGGTSVGSNYDVQFTASDVYGGTTIRVYWIPDERTCSGNGAACTRNSDCPSGQVCRHDVTRTNLVGQMRKTTSGRSKLSIDWNIATVPDGRYVLFGALEPGPGADGTERSFTTPRGGRNNVGDGSLTVTRVNIAGTARLETWTAVCVSSDGTTWRVNSTISQPVLNETDPELDPYPRAIAGQPYISIRDEVRFTITQGATPFTAGDTLSFTTTGVTAVSSAVTIASGNISEDPVAVIVASPLSGDPPLNVSFDGLGSFDPNGEDLLFEWAFGDGSSATGAVAGHTYESAGTFTAVLIVTNVNNGRGGAAAVDIVVTNNSPQAVLSAVPSSGPAGCSSDCALTVQFNGAESGDRETSSDQLIYRWDFGDGKTANDARIPGLAFVTQSHTYRNRADGTACTSQNPCELSATLTVIDADGKQDTATTGILVGNSQPVASVIAGPLQGSAPLTVRFNALNSIDADNDELIVDWDWGDGSKSLNVPVSGGGAGADGTVEHEYADTGEYTPTAIVRDRLTLSTPGVATAAWPGVKIVVLEGGTGGTNLRAIIRTNPTTIVVNEPFAADGLSSIGDIGSYGWSWGDGTSGDSGATATHTYTNTGAFQITLIVTDAGGETNSTSKTVVVVAAGEGDGEPDEENGRPIASLVVDPPTAEALVNEAFTFDARGSSDPDGDALRFLWTFGDGSPPVEGGVEAAFLSHAYNTTGQFLVRLTVRDASNAQASISQAVRVLAIGENRRPVPIIATGPRTASVPATLSFDGNASYDPDGDPIQFSWRFDLGAETITQTGAVVSQRFDSPGTFSVVLIVRDSEDAESESDPETILITPRVELPPPPSSDPIDDAAGQDIPDSAQQRPEGICGFGMIPALFGSMLGLSTMWLARRKRRP